MNKGVWSPLVSAVLTFLMLHAPISHQEQARQKRFLIYPRQGPTRYQFIAGIGIPADLEYESLTIGHVLKAMFYLPYEASVYRQNPYLPEYKRIITQLNAPSFRQELRALLLEPTKMRWNIYSYIEHIMNDYGYNGHECLLQAICEANSWRFAPHFSVMADLLHLILTPSSTLNEKTAQTRDFLTAETVGHSGEQKTCEIYNCNMELLNTISHVLNINI